MKSLCWDLEEMHTSHATVEVQGKDMQVLACMHDQDVNDRSRDWFVYRARDMSQAIIAFDEDGEIAEHFTLMPANSHSTLSST